jgi:hypothetical protein
MEHWGNVIAGQMGNSSRFCHQRRGVHINRSDLPSTDEVIDLTPESNSLSIFSIESHLTASIQNKCGEKWQEEGGQRVANPKS